MDKEASPSNSSEQPHEGAAERLPPMDARLPIAGIGASAGGLEAFTDLLRNLPPDIGMAFVLIQHFDPRHDSLLVSILSENTRLSVVEATENMAVEAGHVYVIPPNVEMILADGRLKLSARPSSPHPQMPIDVFFRSLAEEQNEKAIGVVLSGNASDGSTGLLAIKNHGGITFCQDQASSKYPEMPANAQGTGAVDFILPPDLIALRLATLSQHPYLSEPDAPEDKRSPVEEKGLQEIFAKLKEAFKVDFSSYKDASLRRRVLRRMALSKIDSFDRYALHLGDNPDELQLLHRDIFIKVTCFFRDPEVFDDLKATVFPEMITERDASAPIRVWVAGCSTGEEVYSIAICFTEFLRTRGSEIPIQIFASDIDKGCLEKARTGRYPASIADHVSAERLSRFFTEVDGGFQVSKSLRDICIFAHQDVNQDPPFSRLDLVSCRNLMIYLTLPSQQTLLGMFHWSLKPTGFLMLGNSETVGSLSTLFSPHSRKNRLYRNVRAATPPPQTTTLRTYDLNRMVVTKTAVLKYSITGDQREILTEADRLILNKYTLPAVVINDQMDIVQYRGDTGPFLAVSPGLATHNLFNMLRDGLLGGVRTAIAEATGNNLTRRKENLKVRSSGGRRSVSIEVVPFHSVGSDQRYYLVIFDEKSPRQFEVPPASRDNSHGPDELRFQEELASVREHLQSVIEQKDSILTELQSANQETLSRNEEFQSMNEELETAKEELQSSNEELITMNEELVTRNVELDRSKKALKISRDYLDSVLQTVPGPLLVLDHNLRVLEANRAFCDIFKVPAIETVHQPIHIVGSGQWNIPSLLTLLNDVLSTNTEFMGFETTVDIPQLGSRTVRMNARQVYQDEQGTQTILLAIEDITMERNEKVNLKELNSELQRRSMDLGRSNSELEGFAAIASHDLQAPLHKIFSFGELLVNLEGNLGDKGKLYVERIQSAAMRMKSQIQSLLSLAHVDQSPSEFRSVDLSVVLTHVLADLEMAIEQSNARVTVAQLPLVHGDEAQLVSLFQNLVGNALKYCALGSKPYVRVECGPAANGFEEISVKDDGIGFEAKHFQVVFEPFRRLHGQREYEGNGIGLAICKKIVERHEGEIHVNSTVGKGTTFKIKLHSASAVPAS